MSVVFAPFVRLFSDIVQDIKSSRRFQVCTVLWLPLVIVAFICVVRLGIRHTMSQQFKQWNTAFIPESSGIAYPDVQFQFSQPYSLSDPTFGSVSCQQNGINVPRSQCCAGCPLNQCFIANISGFQASLAARGHNRVTCNIIINGVNPLANQEVALSIAQGYVWFPNPPTYITPNQNISVLLFRDLFIPGDGTQTYEWGVERMYESSIFNNPWSGTFNMSLAFHIPFRAVTVYVAYDAFDSWMMLAAWGGFFTFVAFLHAFVFFFVKLYTADDSKLLREGVASAGSYDQMRS